MAIAPLPRLAALAATCLVLWAHASETTAHRAANAAAEPQAAEVAVLAADDECGSDQQCALDALQRRGLLKTTATRSREEIEALVAAAAESEEEILSEEAQERQVPGLCTLFPTLPVCGGGNLPHPSWNNPVVAPSGGPSTAPLQTFYMYRVQSDENYAPESQDMTNLAGMLWYLHNEIVYHTKGRQGSYFLTQKTRIEKFRVQTRATQALFAKGMNFGVMNPFDSGRCTGPYDCQQQYSKYGYTVGCETWQPGSGSNFPHSQWNNLNHYKGAIWYSLPGSCSSRNFQFKDDTCKTTEHGGACPVGVTPTGAVDCTYQYQKVAEIAIDELEGIQSFEKFVAMGGREYNSHTDQGTHLHFWDGKKDPAACERRVQRAEMLFQKHYPHLPHLPDPRCDFNQHKFYEN